MIGAINMHIIHSMPYLYVAYLKTRAFIVKKVLPLIKHDAKIVFHVICQIADFLSSAWVKNHFIAHLWKSLWCFKVDFLWHEMKWDEGEIKNNFLPATLTFRWVFIIFLQSWILSSCQRRCTGHFKFHIC
jgi:hypothetical protein